MYSKKLDGYTHLCFACVISEWYYQGDVVPGYDREHAATWPFGLIILYSKVYDWALLMCNCSVGCIDHYNSLALALARWDFRSRSHG